MAVALRNSNFNSALAGWGIFLVVVGHSSGALPAVSESAAIRDMWYLWLLKVIEIIYIFHMPLFFFLAGVNYAEFTSQKKLGWVSLMKGKTLRLVVPYLFFTAVAFPIKCALSAYALRPVGFTFSAFMKGILYPWDNPIIFFWFLPALYLIFLVAPLVVAINLALFRILIAMLSIVGFLCTVHNPGADNPLGLLNVGGAIHNFVFFLVGYECIRLRFLNIQNLAVMIGIAAVLGMSATIFNLGDAGRLSLLFFAMTGIFASCMITKFFLQRSQVVVYIGTFAFQIYLFSWFVQIPIRVVFGQWLSLIWVSVILSIVAGLVVPVLIANALDGFVAKRYRCLYGR